MEKSLKGETLTALMVADYLLYKAKKEGAQITNKKLQKLLYYVQAWSAALQEKRIFEDRIEAWVHGPAIKAVYLEYQKFGAQPINKAVSEADIQDIPKEVASHIDQVWSVYGKYDGNYLEQLTHSESPWQDARKGLEPHISSETEITFESMRDFYRTKL